MKNLFEQSCSHWVWYDHYKLKSAEDGKRYITPGKNTKSEVYNPLKEVPNIVLDALNVGMMTTLPTTPSFMDYEAVYLQKNHFIKEESMGTDEYLSLENIKQIYSSICELNEKINPFIPT